METLILVLHVLAAFSIIGLVLLQHGKGADVGAAFGSGASGSIFGSTGSANFLSRATAVLAAVFFLTSMGLTYLSSGRADHKKGVMESQPAPESPMSAQIPPTAPAKGQAGAGQPVAPEDKGAKSPEVPK
jgi:preprotein translocase subunit SecG